MNSFKFEGGEILKTGWVTSLLTKYCVGKILTSLNSSRNYLVFQACSKNQTFKSQLLSATAVRNVEIKEWFKLEKKLNMCLPAPYKLL